MLDLLVRGPLALLYGVGIVIMMCCAVPFILVGFLVGFVKWSCQIGTRLSDRAFLHFMR